MIARTVLALVSVAALTGCSAIHVGHTPPEARPCGDVYKASRCAAIDDRVASRPEIDPAAVVDVLIVPYDPVGEDGVIKTLGGAPALVVRVVLADGITHDISLGCAGIGDPSDPICTDDPRLMTFAVGGEGYRDIPCGEDGDTCATPPPQPAPELIAASEPIIVDRADVPIDHVGPYEVRIGAGSLPNGILTDASFRLDDEWLDDVAFEGGRILLDVRSLEPDGRPFDNYYNHGWREGLERIEAVLVFDVRDFEPGATLPVRDVLVR